MTRFASRPRIIAVVIVGSLAITACGIRELDLAKVPDGSKLGLSFSCPKDSAKTSSDCTVNAEVLLSTQETAGKDWIVDLLVDNGSFVPTSGDSIIRARRLVTGPAGEASVNYHTPVEPGTVTFTLAARGIVTTETLKVIDRDVGDDPPVVAITLSPAPISVKKGDSIQVTASFKDATGKTLKGRLAYFSTDNANASVPPGPADKAWVKGVDTGTAILRVSRRAIISSTAVTITP